MQNKGYPSIHISDCKHHDYNIHPIGPRYCPKCNSIILFAPHMRKYFKEIEDEIVDILTHEEMHWWLCMNIDEEASIGFDVICEPKNEPSDEYIQIPDDLRNIFAQFLPDK